MKNQFRLASLVAALAIVAAACGGGGGATNAPAGTQPATSEAPAGSDAARRRSLLPRRSPRATSP